MSYGTEGLTGCCALRQHLHMMGLLESAKCRECEQEEVFSYHVICQCSILTGHRLEIFGSEWVKPIDV
jgi:hypothetical protein